MCFTEEHCCMNEASSGFVPALVGQIYDRWSFVKKFTLFAWMRIVYEFFVKIAMFLRICLFITFFTTIWFVDVPIFPSISY